MLQAIFDAITGFIDTCMTICDFVIDTIQDILYVVKLTAETVASIPDYFAWMPPAALATVVTIFGVVVIYKVLGREG